MAEERALTLKDVAARLSVSERTVLRLAEERALIGYKVGHAWRFEPSAVRDFVEKQQEEKQTLEERQPGANAILDQEGQYWTTKGHVDEWPETRQWIINFLKANPGLKMRWEPEHGILIGIQEQITVTVENASEKKHAPELAVVRR